MDDITNIASNLTEYDNLYRSVLSKLEKLYVPPNISTNRYHSLSFSVPQHFPNNVSHNKPNLNVFIDHSSFINLITVTYIVTLSKHFVPSLTFLLPPFPIFPPNYFNRPRFLYFHPYSNTTRHLKNITRHL